MYIPTDRIITIVIVIALFALWGLPRLTKTNRLAKYMSELDDEVRSVIYELDKITSNEERLSIGIEAILPHYKDYMRKKYTYTGSYNSGEKQYLYDMSKTKSARDFTKVTLFNYVSAYIDEHSYELSEAKGGYLYKTEQCKGIDELYLCIAKSCLKINNVRNFASIYLELIEKYVSSDVVTICRL